MPRSETLPHRCTAYEYLQCRDLRHHHIGSLRASNQEQRRKEKRSLITSVASKSASVAHISGNSDEVVALTNGAFPPTLSHALSGIEATFRSSTVRVVAYTTHPSSVWRALMQLCHRSHRTATKIRNAMPVKKKMGTCLLI